MLHGTHPTLVGDDI